MVHDDYLTKALGGFAAQFGNYSFEMKSLGEDGVFAGYASVFNLVDSQQDIVLPGAFARSLKLRDAPVQLLWQHQQDQPIGVIESLTEDKHGLFVRGRLLLAVAQAREAYALLKARAIRGLSIGYQVRRARRDATNGARLLQDLDLREISLVTFPANEAAQVTVVKSQDAAVAALLEMIDRASCALF